MVNNLTLSWAQIDRQKGDLNCIKCTCTRVMVFHRVRLRVKLKMIFFSNCYCHARLLCHPTFHCPRLGMDWQKSNVIVRKCTSTPLMLFHRVRLQSSSTGSFFPSVTAKPVCFVTQADSVFGFDLNGIKCTSTRVMVFNRVRLKEDPFHLDSSMTL